MKPIRYALLATLWLASALYAADIDGPSEVEGQRTIKLKAKDIPPKTGVSWKLKALDGQDMTKVEWLSGSSRRAKEIHWIGPLGRYQVTLTTLSIDKDGTPEFDEVEKVVTLGKGEPKPPDPPGPKPPEPPGPVPIPGDGLRVLMVYESADASSLTPGQQAVLYAKSVRDYLNAKCPAGPDGKTKEWRIYDKDVDLSGESKTWQDAMKRPRTSIPWIIISNGKQGFEGPLPADADKALELLRKFGGA